MNHAEARGKKKRRRVLAEGRLGVAQYRQPIYIINNNIICRDEEINRYATEEVRLAQVLNSKIPFRVRVDLVAKVCTPRYN